MDFPSPIFSQILLKLLIHEAKKWGIKLWGRASSSGFLHTFDVYQGKGTGIGEVETKNCGLGGNVVLQLSETLPKKPFKIFADNFFTNFAVAAEVKPPPPPGFSVHWYDCS